MIFRFLESELTMAMYVITAAMYRYTMNYWLWVVFYVACPGMLAIVTCVCMFRWDSRAPVATAQKYRESVRRRRLQNATERFNPAANANRTLVKELDVEPEGPDFLFRSKQRRHRTTLG